MSADNWAVCPACLHEAREAHHALQAEATAAYGKVSVEEFDALRARAEKGVNEEDFRTFREDYEIYGADDGTIVVSYGGSCSKCKVGTSFTHYEPFWTAPLPQPTGADSTEQSDEMGAP